MGETTSATDRPEICDVIITTRDRPEALRRCLLALANQSISGFGVIVVDDGSDRPLAEADLAPAGLPVTFLRHDVSAGPAAGRNAGVAASRAEFVVFVDDDVVASRHFIECHLAAVTSPSGAEVPIVSCGPFLQPADWDPTPWNLWENRGQKKEAENVINGVFDVTWRLFHTGNNCVPRSVFVELGGFDESFTRAEDDEFALRMHERGCVFRFVPDAIAWHYSNRSLASWLEIPRLYARYDVEIDRQHPEVGYLADKKRELATRRLPLRVARAVFGGPRRSRVGVAAAVTLGRLLHRGGAIGPSMGALSVAYDLSYVASLRESERTGAAG